MITVKNNGSDSISFTGCIEGFKILAHNQFGSGTAPVPFDYRKVEIDWQTDGEQTFSGSLAQFLSYMYLRMGTSDERQLYIKYLAGKYLGPTAKEVIADLSVDFPAFYGNHTFSVRMTDVFTETNLASYILFDFDKSDEISDSKFKILRESVREGAVKELNISGTTSCVVFSDNTGAYGTFDQVPLTYLTCSSKYWQARYTGYELLALQDLNKGEVVIQSPDGTFSNVNGNFLSLKLTDREFLDNPTFSLQLDTVKMATMIQGTNSGFTITYDLCTLQPDNVVAQQKLGGRSMREAQRVLMS